MLQQEIKKEKKDLHSDLDLHVCKDLKDGTEKENRKKFKYDHFRNFSQNEIFAEEQWRKSKSKKSKY